MSNLVPAPEHDACGVGFLADLSQRASHDVIRLSLEAAAAMAHRGARAADGRTGDGARAAGARRRARCYLRELVAEHVRIPERHLGAICLFLPRDSDDAADARAKIEAAVRLADVAPLRWRMPVVDPDVLGEYARRTAPPYEQLLVDMGPGNVRERMRVVRAAVVAHRARDLPSAVLVSASPTKVVYKALLSSNELGDVLRRPARPAVRLALRRVPPALQHEHLAAVAPRAAVQLHRAQRRDQHDHREPRLDAGARHPAALVGQRFA